MEQGAGAEGRSPYAGDPRVAEAARTAGLVAGVWAAAGAALAFVMVVQAVLIDDGMLRGVILIGAAIPGILAVAMGTSALRTYRCEAHGALRAAYALRLFLGLLGLIVVGALSDGEWGWGLGALALGAAALGTQRLLAQTEQKLRTGS
ncbi:hypothetical protein EDD29_5975 [Actinocorallia herbida]|uniref:Uncharacterized protein n=1 Tax=Actinocorallia herbida TaxID=58109 RepID=A0A3N1D453_9ACTN|nr:hypothetical protein [Actinocorallia herbida]ROO88312.1 hypothetical protein EDD29_5975 [Actinocorallia herbida]